MDEKKFISLLEQSCNYSSSILLALAEALDVPERPLHHQVIESSGLYNIVIPVSGGLDSTVAHLLYGEFSKNIYFDFGQSYANRERDALKKLGIKHQVLTLAHLPTAWQHIIPARNMYLLLKSAEFVADEGTIVFAVTRGEHPAQGGDKSKKFVQLMTEVIGRGVQIQVLNEHTKSGWVKLMGAKAEYLLQTFSCFFPTYHGKQCGTCQACLRHFVAFENNGLGKRLLNQYDRHPLVGAARYVRKYRKAMLQELRHPGMTKYGFQRSRAMLSVIAPDILIDQGVEPWK